MRELASSNEEQDSTTTKPYALNLGPRQYQPIWTQLKALPAKQAATQGVSVTAPRALHKRIVKAVVKEKWLDVGFKLEMRAKARNHVSCALWLYSHVHA